jgi:Site-specific recombinase XerD
VASLNREKSGTFRIQWRDDNGAKTLRIGKVPKKTAEHVLVKVEALISAKASGMPLDQETSKWLAGIDETLEDRLFRVGLIASKREAEETEGLGTFLRSFLDGRNDLKPATKVVRGQVIRDLTQFFGEGKDIRSIKPGDADDFKQWLIGRGLASTTIHKRLQNARSFFIAAKRRKLIDENPFEGVKMAASGIRDRQRFISREDVAKVLEACPNHHWRSIVALSRYGGLRCPSEVLSLKWDDIHWDESRMLVESPKMEHHADKAVRVVPIFPELRPFLEEAWELAPEGAVYVVDERFRKAAMRETGWLNANLRTTFEKIIRRAGLVPWPRPFHNLRSSRETELVEQFPIQVVTDWLGNSPKIAMRHYLQTTEEHFRRAIGKSDDKSDVKSDDAKSGNGWNGDAIENSQNDETPVFPGFANRYKLLPHKGMAGAGFEPTTSRL